MSDKADIEDRLRRIADIIEDDFGTRVAGTVREAADLIASQEAEIADLRAERDALVGALKPFADYADPAGHVPDDFPITLGSRLAKRQLTMGDCYDACRILEAHDGE